MKEVMNENQLIGKELEKRDIELTELKVDLKNKLEAKENEYKA